MARGPFRIRYDPRKDHCRPPGCGRNCVRLKYEDRGIIYAITVDGLGEVKILVPDEDWERAQAVLSQTVDEKDLDLEEPSAKGPLPTPGLSQCPELGDYLLKSTLPRKG
jgi:hypothetical protein